MSIKGDEPARLEVPGLRDEVIESMLSEHTRQIRRSLRRDAEKYGQDWLYKTLCQMKIARATRERQSSH